MKIAFCTSVFRPDELISTIYRLAQLGYDGVELRQQQFDYHRWAILKAAVADAGMAVAQVSPYFDLVNGPEKIEASVKQAEQFVKMAAESPGGPALVRVFTGPLDGPGAVSSAKCSQANWAAAVAGMRRICRLGEPHGVRFALETHHNMLIDTSASITQFLRDVGMANLGVNLQVPLDDDADPVVSARKLGQHVIHLHANNERDGHNTFLADGIYDFPAFLRAVVESGPFDGFVSVEHAYHHPLWQTAVVEIDYLKKVIATIPPRAGKTD